MPPHLAIFGGTSPKVGTSSQVGASKSGLTQQEAAGHHDSVIVLSGRPGKGRNWNTLNFEPITQIGAVRQIDPIAACADGRACRIIPP